MLNWFRRRRDRNIFRYHNGEKWTAADPIAVQFGLESHPEFIADRHLSAAEDNDREAMQITARAVRDVFKVKSFEDDQENGFTVLECLELLMKFFVYCDRLKKKYNLSQTAGAPSEWTSNESSDATTKPSSGSGSTGNGHTSDMQPLSKLEPKQAATSYSAGMPPQSSSLPASLKPQS